MPTNKEIEKILSNMVSNIKFEKLDSKSLVIYVDYETYIKQIFDLFNKTN